VIAVEREGMNGVAVHRLPLKAAPLAWVPGASQPELRVEQVAPQPRNWNYARNLLDADGLDPAITVDLERWRPVAFADDGRPSHWEPDGDDGAVLRFGDGVFGLPAEAGAVFDVTYRVGAGAAGNLPADAISEIPVPGIVTAVRNPMPSKHGVDQESAPHVRRFAPQAFRVHPLRAVITDDYEVTARELAWVQNAGARFRWTGSWHSVFTAVDPKGGFDLGLLRHIELAQLIDRRRLAGVEAFVPPPRFVSIDLEIEICVAAGARRDEVERRVLERLAPTSRDSQTSGFFFADHFTLGTPIYRARLEEAVARIGGVKGVLGIRYRRRDSLKDFKPLPALLKLGADEILRVDNDRDRPERGTIRIFAEGGA
jgi:predicted phage baseplate assembly protein